MVQIAAKKNSKQITKKDTFICVELHACCINNNAMFEIPALKHNKVI